MKIFDNSGDVLLLLLILLVANITLYSLNILIQKSPCWKACKTKTQKWKNGFIFGNYISFFLESFLELYLCSIMSLLDTNTTN